MNDTGVLPRPGLVYGVYPQRTRPRPRLWLDVADRVGDRISALAAIAPWRAPRFLTILEAERAESMRAKRSRDVRLLELRATLSRHGWTAATAARAQLLIAAAIEETLGKRPYETQHLAAWQMLGDRLVEMETGEGKTIAVLMAAATAALAGVPVHVVTANDYLAERDASTARDVLAGFGMRVAAIQPAMDSDARRVAYACDIVYCTARELGFDYLRDHMMLEAARRAGRRANARPVLRGLCMALIDEADSVLIDHARTPLIIAERAEVADATTLRRAIYDLSGTLERGRDYELFAQERRAELNASALRRLEAALAGVPGRPTDRRVSAQLLSQALVVRHVLERDRHYVVQAVDGVESIVLIDETTGRTMPGTVWTRGISELVALKEGCPQPEATRTLHQITLQRLFARYWRLGGVSGTLRESRLELFTFYRLRVGRVEPRKACQRRDSGLRLYADRARQFDAVAASVRSRVANCQPVLIGTGSIAESEALAAHLQRAGLEPTVLNARNDADEAACIARAGLARQVTVTTNMAGRGTDIAPDGQALAAGGLHVISCTLNRSRRIDRQLFGRCARNGQPGSCETVLALDEGMFARSVSDGSRAVLRAFTTREARLPRLLAVPFARSIQFTQAWRDFIQRWQIVQHDRRVDEMLAYTRGAG